jgi:peptidoglycan/LPS O-acetylase OafA/YrhL
MSRDVLIPKARFFKTAVIDSNRNIGLDIIRAICVIVVVLSHTNNYFGVYTGIYKVVFPLGYMFQDLFFALSGFLVGKQIIRHINTPGSNLNLITFYKNRWIRTVPFYFIFLLINFFVFHAIYQHVDLLLFKKTSFSFFNYLTFTQNLYIPHPTFFPEIWPLPIEEWSFLLLPIPIFLISVLFKKTLNTKNLLTLLFIEIIIVTLYRVYYIIQSDPELDWELRKIVVYRLDALLYGFVVRIFSDNYSYVFNKNKLWLLIVGIVLSFGFYFSKPYLPILLYKSLFFTVIPIGMSFALPYFYFGNFNGWSQRLKSILTHISLTSYVVLLSHLYLIQFGMLCIYVPLNFIEALFFTIVYFGIIICFTTLFFNYIERPILLMRKKL